MGKTTTIIIGRKPAITNRAVYASISSSNIPVSISISSSVPSSSVKFVYQLELKRLFVNANMVPSVDYLYIVLYVKVVNATYVMTFVPIQRQKNVDRKKSIVKNYTR